MPVNCSGPSRISCPLACFLWALHLRWNLTSRQWPPVLPLTSKWPLSLFRGRRLHKHFHLWVVSVTGLTTTREGAANKQTTVGKKEQRRGSFTALQGQSTFEINAVQLCGRFCWIVLPLPRNKDTVNIWQSTVISLRAYVEIGYLGRCLYKLSDHVCLMVVFTMCLIVPCPHPFLKTYNLSAYSQQHCFCHKNLKVAASLSNLISVIKYNPEFKIMT